MATPRLSDYLDGCGNDQSSTFERPFQGERRDGELHDPHYYQRKEDQPSSQDPWRWTVLAADRTVYETPPETNDLCERCQSITEILTRVLLCWDEIPPMWAAARFAPDTWRRSRLPVLREFRISFGGLCLTKTANCGFCDFASQLAQTTLQSEGVDQQEEVVVLLSTSNIGKVELQPNVDDEHERTVKWRKALSLGIYSAKCAAELPPPGGTTHGSRRPCRR